MRRHAKCDNVVLFAIELELDRVVTLMVIRKRIGEDLMHVQCRFTVVCILSRS